MLLTERQIDRSQSVERGKLAWIGLGQADMRYRFDDGVRLDDFLSVLALLLHTGRSRLFTDVEGNEYTLISHWLLIPLSLYQWVGLLEALLRRRVYTTAPGTRGYDRALHRSRVAARLC